MSQSTCGKCSGTGVLNQFMHIDNGKCFDCDGTGTVDTSSNTDNSEVVDHIYWLAKSDGNTVYYAYIYIWAKDTGKKHAGTGHWMTGCIHYPRGTYHGIGESDLHISLEECREAYVGLRDNGYELIPDAEMAGEIEAVTAAQELTEQRRAS